MQATGVERFSWYILTAASLAECRSASKRPGQYDQLSCGGGIHLIDAVDKLVACQLDQASVAELNVVEDMVLADCVDGDDVCGLCDGCGRSILDGLGHQGELGVGIRGDVACGDGCTGIHYECVCLAG